MLAQRSDWLRVTWCFMLCSFILTFTLSSGLWSPTWGSFITTTLRRRWGRPWRREDWKPRGAWSSRSNLWSSLSTTGSILTRSRGASDTVDEVSPRYKFQEKKFECQKPKQKYIEINVLYNNNCYFYYYYITHNSIVFLNYFLTVTLLLLLLLLLTDIHNNHNIIMTLFDKNYNNQ